jgi:hypothetical protein
MALPPGIIYLGHNLHYLVIPPACVYTINLLIEEAFGFHVPGWLIIVASVLAFPIAFTAIVFYKLHVDKREAAAHGAVLPPCPPDKSIGGYKTLLRGMAHSKTGYIGTENMTFLLNVPEYALGEFLNSVCEQYGNTVNMRILFENKVHILYLRP